MGALDCIVRGVVLPTDEGGEKPRGISWFTEGRGSEPFVRLSTHGGNGEIYFRLVFQYRELPHANGIGQTQSGVSPTFYRYDILDSERREIVAYHFHPEGVSPVRSPHLHVSAAPPITLPQPGGPASKPRKLDLGKLHLLTGWVTIEDIVEILIREFSVDPRRPDWERVLAEGRTGGALG